MQRIKLFNLDVANLDDHSRSKEESQALKLLRLFKTKPLLVSIFFTFLFFFTTKVFFYSLHESFDWRLEDFFLFTTFAFINLIMFTVISRGIEYYGRNMDRLILKGNDNNERFSHSAMLGLKKLSHIRDKSTREHLHRIGKASVLVARKLAQTEKYRKYLTDSYIQDLEVAAPLHEIGRVGIPDLILYKDSGLTEAEFEQMKMHTIIGGDLLAEMETEVPYQSYFALAQQMAYHHHQRWDGTGYPNVLEINNQVSYFIQEGIGNPLKGEQIPLAARIVAVVDVYDALVSKKIYKEAFSHQQAVQLIKDEKEKHFDPDIVEAFLSRQAEIHSLLLENNS